MISRRGIEVGGHDRMRVKGRWACLCVRIRGGGVGMRPGIYI